MSVASLQLSAVLPLTCVQRSVLQTILRLQGQLGCSPTLVEIAAERSRSKVSIRETVKRLEELGYLTSKRHHARSIQLTSRCFAQPALVIAGGVPASAQCGTCEEFVIAPHLQLGEPQDGRDELGAFVARTVTVDCPHCERKTEYLQKRYL